MRDLNEWAQEIHANNVAAGWWEDEPCIYTKMQLISTEIAEATEGERKNLMDDKLAHRKMGEVELADALIRTLDLGAHLNLTYKSFFTPYILDDKPIAAKHFQLNGYLIELGFRIHNHIDEYISYVSRIYSVLINALIIVSESKGYDIESAMIEKLEFNKTRQDHQPENRAKAHGKKF
uniref:Uncharacterized protein n=1 Tax=Hydrogenovibrio crunogenus (strain DSM 25203 / XCL-2) TaxID=317025 RepID=Q31HX0_HYDCU